MSDYNTGREIAVAECHGKLSTGLRITIPSDIFSTNRSIYAKVERRGGFFDDFGWIEMQAEGLPIAERRTNPRDRRTVSGVWLNDAFAVPDVEVR